MVLEILFVIGVIIFVIVGLIVYALVRSLSGTEVEERMKVYATVPDLGANRPRGRRNSRLARLRLRLNAVLSDLGSEDLNLQLMSANWRITVTEYVLIRLGAMVLSLLLGWFLLGSLISGLALLVIANFIPGILLQRAIHRRRIQFEKQLVDVLVLINGAVRSGFSLLQAVEVVERELKPPASDEFRRVQREVGLGFPIGEALANLSARMENPDLELMVTAVKINYTVGGNLATMLSAVTETIRDRIRLFSEVRVITTQQRYTSYLISLLPFFIGALLFLLNPEYMMKIFQPGPILCIPIGALCGIIAGYFVIRRLGRIDI